jgi:hypothetical protein
MRDSDKVSVRLSQHPVGPLGMRTRLLLGLSEQVLTLSEDTAPWG